MPNARMNCFVDTNVLVYAADKNNPDKRTRAREWLDVLANNNSLVLSPQSISEFYHVSRRRFSDVGRAEIVNVCEWLLVWCTATLDPATIRRAWSIEEATKYHWFDCLLLAAALRAGCPLFLSEDLQHDRVIDGLRVIDPFRCSPSEVLAS